MKTIEESRRYFVIYEHGVVKSIYPQPEGEYDIRDYVYYATRLFIDGKPIDLLKPDDIAKVDPDMGIEPSSSSVVQLGYNLRFQAENIRAAGMPNQSVRILRLSNRMLERSMFCKPDTFFRLAEWLYEDGRDAEAEAECRNIREQINKHQEKVRDYWQQIWENQLAYMRNFNIDLVMIGYSYTCCGECAKYRSRIYSFSGRDRRFPPLPDTVKRTGHIHDGCSCSVSPTDLVEVDVGIKDNKPYYLKGDDAIRYSNRPFVDDRDEAEKARYQAIKERHEKEALRMQYIGFEERVRTVGKNKRAYRLICENVPELAPSSYNAYLRAKKQRTKKYLLLVERMQEKGIDIEVTDHVRGDQL